MPNRLYNVLLAHAEYMEDSRSQNNNAIEYMFYETGSEGL